MSAKYTIYLLDDDELSSQILRHSLEQRGYRCFWFSTPEEMYARMKLERDADLFLLDYALGGKNPSGADVCRKVKTQNKKPVVMLTGDRTTATVVECIAVGADLYIEKPYEFEQLVAKISAILRLYRNLSKSVRAPAKSTHLILDEIAYSPQKRQFSNKDGETRTLTEKESIFFEILCGKPEYFVTREEAYYGIYGRSMDPMNRGIDNLACRLRMKLRELAIPVDILVLRGIGYRMIKKQQSPNA